MDILLASFLGAFTPSVMIYVAAGVFLGLAVGAIPGLSAAMAIALAVPLTYTLSPVASIGFLVGVYKGGSYGGSLSAILLNTPGAPEAAATGWRNRSSPGNRGRCSSFLPKSTTGRSTTGR